MIQSLELHVSHFGHCQTFQFVLNRVIFREIYGGNIPEEYSTSTVKWERRALSLPHLPHLIGGNLYKGTCVCVCVCLAVYLNV